MKIAYMPDLHLESSGIEINNTNGADILVLAGDIFVANDLKDQNIDYSDDFELINNIRSFRIHNFFSQCSKLFKHVIFVAGNHESYHSDFDKTIPNIKNKLKYIKNLHILEKESIIIDGVKFVGATLWTDMNDNCESSKEIIKRYMGDFRLIQKNGRKFTPNHAIEEHNNTLWFLNDATKPDNKIVVVTHHQPSPLSIADEFKDDELMNGGYCSDLTEFIENRPQIKLWIAGHTHNNWDYMVGDTRILCNPRGYRHEQSFINFKLYYVEL